MMRLLSVFTVTAVLLGLSACMQSASDSASAHDGDEVQSVDASQQASQQSPTRALEPAAVTAPAKAAPTRPLLQVGPWYPATFNIEEPYINLLHASRFIWQGGGKETWELLEEGYIDPVTQLPTSLPNGKWLHGEVFFTGNTPEQRMHWDGEWVLEWEGDADLWVEFLPREMQWRESKNRIVFTRDYKRGKTLDHSRIQIRRMNGPLTALRIYRAENESALKAGKIYNPKFIEAVAGYDVVRTMDLQSVNVATIRSVDEQVGMETPFWGSTDWSNVTGEPWFHFHNQKQGMPIEAAFKLGVESGGSVWFQAPLTLGAPTQVFEFRPEDGRHDLWAWQFGEAAGQMAQEVIESEEWDRYADAFVEGLIASGYPEDRPLYVSLANEVWNYAGQYFLTTTYAQRMGIGLGPSLGLSNSGAREGYGALMARFKLAVDAALVRAGRTQDIAYVVEGQAVWVELTGAALKGAKAYMENKGEQWGDHAPGFGVSVASYWGYHEGLASSGVDVNDLAALEDYFLNGSERHLGTKANVVKLFRGAQAQGAQYGVRLLGAYEGGPHFTRPGEMDRKLYREFVWGTRGGRVNYEVNKALADAFPGIILSNYGLAGASGGQPWFEGKLGADNPYALSWDGFKRPLDEHPPQ